jgi:hypothetical protein
MRDSLIDRHAATNSKEQDGDDQAPEVQLLAMTKGMKLIGGPLAAVDAEQQQQLVPYVHYRMDTL